MSTERKNYVLHIAIENATEEEAGEVVEEIAGAIEDARDSSIWVAPVTVSTNGFEEVKP